MHSKEFETACREVNRAYRDIFGTVPVLDDYSCTREEFLATLKQAVAENKTIETYLLKRVWHKDGRLE